MTHVHTTLIRLPTKKTDTPGAPCKSQEVLVCFHDEDSEEEWVTLTDFMLNESQKYKIQHLKTWGVVLTFARGGIGWWNVTLNVGGFAYVANYWILGGLVAGCTLGMEIKVDANHVIQSVAPCIVDSKTKECSVIDTRFTAASQLYMKIATYHGETSAYISDGFLPAPGHNAFLRDPIQVVACQHSSFTVYMT